MLFNDFWETRRRILTIAGQAQIEKRLPELLVKAGFSFASKCLPGEPLSDRIVLGVAEYSERDYALLDAICERGRGPLVEVFLMSECRSLSDVEAYVPAVGQVYHTPVVGIWRAGSKTYAGSGHSARMAIQQELDLSPL